MGASEPWPTTIRSTSSARSTARSCTTRSWQAQHELAVRYDFKGTRASIDLQQERQQTDPARRSQGAARHGHPDPQGEDGQARGGGQPPQAGEAQEATPRLGARGPLAPRRDRVDDAKSSSSKSATGDQGPAQIMDERSRTGKKIDELPVGDRAPEGHTDRISVPVRQLYVKPPHARARLGFVAWGGLRVECLVAAGR